MHLIFCRPVISHHVDIVYEVLLSLSYSAYIFQDLQNCLSGFPVSCLSEINNIMKSTGFTGVVLRCNTTTAFAGYI